MRVILLSLIFLLCASQLYAEDKISSKPAYPVVGSIPKKGNLTPFFDNEATNKIIKRTNLEREGRYFAKQGLYEEALIKYKAAQDPSLLNYDYEKPELPIIILYMRQGKFEQALQIVEENLKKRPGNQEVDREYRELLALIESRDTKNSKPIYDYIDYLKMKYSKYFPPNGYFVGMSGIYIDGLIHLYDYMHDYDSGIALMDEVIKYMVKDKWMDNLGGRNAIKEYTRVKEAWELDKKTGQHGHLQDVIKTSDIISW